MNQPGKQAPDYEGSVRKWLRGHDGQDFTTADIAAAYGLSHSQTVSSVLRRIEAEGTYPKLHRTGKSGWSLKNKPAEPKFRVTREAPLRNGQRLEVVGHDHAGTMIVRDGQGGLWVLRPLELPA